MNLKEVSAIINSHRTSQEKKAEYEVTVSWEIARWQAFITMLPHVKKNSIKRPTDLAVFPWDQATKAVHIPKEEIFTEEDNEWFEKMKSIPLKNFKQWQQQ